MANYEYSLVPVDRGDYPVYGERLNELAAEGWRLVPIIVPETPESNAVLILERDTEQGIGRNLGG